MHVLSVFLSFPDKALWNHLLIYLMQLQSDLVPLHLSTNVSLWTLKTNYSYQSSDTIWGAIKNKIGYPLVPYAGILLISLQRCEQAVLTKRVKTNVLLLHLSNWQQTQACGLCQKVNAHLYTVSSVDKITAVIVISICFWRDAIMSVVSGWTSVGGAYVNALLWRRCLCKRLCPVDVTLSHRI